MHNTLFLSCKNILLSILSILLLHPIGFAQHDFEKQYGVGMLVITYDSTFVLNLYATPNESDLVFNIRISHDTLDPSRPLIANLTSDQKSWFHPETFWDEERIMHFVTLDQQHEWHKVIVDKTSGKMMWILQSPQVKFFKWKDYLTNTTGVERLTPSDNPVYKSIFPLKTLLDFKEQDCLKIVKVKGYWAKVRYNEEMCPHLNKYNSLPKGWIKWRNDKTMLIRYFLR